MEDQLVKSCSCDCPIGRDKCHHMAALLIWVEKNISRTDIECAWSKPKCSKGEELAAKRIAEMAPETSKGNIWGRCTEKSPAKKSPTGEKPYTF